MRARRVIEMTTQMTILAAAIACVLCLSGCSISQKLTEKSWSERTPKEKAAWMMNVYKQQYDDYLQLVKQLNLTDDERKMLRTKKDILAELDPLIDTYNAFVDSGRMPTDELESAIVRKINDLLYGN